MSGIGKILLSPFAALTGMFDKPKTPTAPPVVDQAAAMDAANQQTADDLRRRQGAAANALTGPTGAEASTPGAKVLLGQ